MTLSDSKNNHAAPHDIKTDVMIEENCNSIKYLWLQSEKPHFNDYRKWHKYCNYCYPFLSHSISLKPEKIGLNQQKIRFYPPHLYT